MIQAPMSRAQQRADKVRGTAQPVGRKKRVTTHLERLLQPSRPYCPKFRRILKWENSCGERSDEKAKTLTDYRFRSRASCEQPKLLPFSFRRTTRRRDGSHRRYGHAPAAVDCRAILRVVLQMKLLTTPSKSRKQTLHTNALLATAKDRKIS